MDILEQVKAEIRDLTREIAECEARRSKLATFLTLYEEVSKPFQRASGGAQVHLRFANDDVFLPTGAKFHMPAVAGFGHVTVQNEPSLAAKVAVWCERYLMGRPHAKIAELLQFLKEMGVEIGGKTPDMALSAMLSRDDRFEADRKYGWSLKRRGTPQLG